MVAIAAQIDSGWLGSSMTFVATRAGTQLGTGAATVASLASGLVKATATIGMSSYGAGRVDLSLIENTTNSLAWLDTIEIDASGDLVAPVSFTSDDSTTLSQIKAKTDLIVNGTVFIEAAVSVTGTISEIIIGDDYLSANGRAFEWTLGTPTGITPGVDTIRFGGKMSGCVDQGWLVSGTTVDLGGGQMKLVAELAKENTEGLLEGEYKWSVEIISGANRITPVKSSEKRKVQLVYKQTQG